MGTEITLEVLTKTFTIVSEFLCKNSDKASASPITEFSIKPGSEQKDNYLSSIYSVKCQVANNNQSFDLILKSQPISKTKIEDEDVTSYYWNIIFAKEHLVYTTILTQMSELSGNGDKFPEFYYFYEEGEKYCCLVLENLIHSGYSIPSARGGGLGLEEMKLLMKNLAHFHALSIVIEGKNGKPLPETYDFCGAETMFNPDLGSVMEGFIQNTYQGVLKSAKTLRPELESFLEGLNSSTNGTVWTQLCDWVKPGKSSFNSLCHGDGRTANLFIRNGEMKMIDFQLVRYASPITDLIYSIYLSTNRAFRSNYLEVILKVYYDEFMSVLSNHPETTFLNPSVLTYTFDLLLAEWTEFKRFGLLIGITFYPILFYSAPAGDRDSDRISIDNMSPGERKRFLHSNREKFVCNAILADSELCNRLFEIVEENFIL